MTERFYYDYEDPEGHKILEDGEVLSELETVGDMWNITVRLNELYNENEQLKEEIIKLKGIIKSIVIQEFKIPNEENDYDPLNEFLKEQIDLKQIDIEIDIEKED